MHKIFCFGVLILFSFTLINGCTMGGLRVAEKRGALEPGQIIDTAGGDLLTAEQLVEKLAEADIIFLGEYHQHVQVHKNQLEIINTLWEKSPMLLIAMEVFPRTSQELLDKWISGEISEEDFKKQVMGGLLNPHTLAVYYPMLKWAREKRIPLLAINAPRKITAKIAAKGLDSLSGEERMSIARDIKLGPPEYMERVTRALKHHKGKLEPANFFAAQVAWDETMAETLADHMTSEGRGRKAVTICGNEHIYHGYGVPDRVERRLRVPQKRILMLAVNENEKLTPEVADYIWAVKPEPPKKRLRLGIALTKDDEGVPVIESVVKGSEAESIGLKAGDKLIAMDGKQIESAMDLHKAAIEGGTDKEHTLKVLRGEEELEFKFQFREEKK